MSSLKTKLIEDISALGALPFFLVIILMLYLLNQISFALQLFVGILAAHIITYLIRLVYHKKRPKPQKYRSLIEKIDASSFPSLHSVRAMTFVIIGIVNIKSALTIFFFSVYALSIMFSRYYLKKHHLTDILAGAIIGFCIGLLVILTAPFY